MNDEHQLVAFVYALTHLQMQLDVLIQSLEQGKPITKAGLDEDGHVYLRSRLQYVQGDMATYLWSFRRNAQLRDLTLEKIMERTPGRRKRTEAEIFDECMRGRMDTDRNDPQEPESPKNPA